MTTPQTCPHCHEQVELSHSFCASCGETVPTCLTCWDNGVIEQETDEGEAFGEPCPDCQPAPPLSLLGENPQVYGSMGAYYREPTDQPTFRGVGEKRQPGEHEFAPRWDHDKNRCVTRCLYCQLPEREWSGDTPCAGEKEKQ